MDVDRINIEMLKQIYHHTDATIINEMQREINAVFLTKPITLTVKSCRNIIKSIFNDNKINVSRLIVCMLVINRMDNVNKDVEMEWLCNFVKSL